MPQGVYIHKKHTEEWKNRMSIIAKERGFGKWMKDIDKNHPFLKTTFQKGTTPWNKGTIGISKGAPKNHPPYFLGNPMYNYCIECGRKIRFYNSDKRKFCSKKCYYKYSKEKPRYNRRGEKSWNWKGGITKNGSNLYHSLEYKNWRRSIFIRDEFTCKKCGIKNVRLEVHHIKSYKENINLLFDCNNAITLCHNCHKDTPNYGGRYWKYYSKEYAKAKKKK